MTEFGWSAPCLRSRHTAPLPRSAPPGIGPAIVPGLRVLPGVELVGLADRNAERLAPWQARLDVPAWADHVAMLADVRPDFATVCPANCEKAGVIADCAAHGVHVFAGKPW